MEDTLRSLFDFTWIIYYHTNIFININLYILLIIYQNIIYGIIIDLKLIRKLKNWFFNILNGLRQIFYEYQSKYNKKNKKKLAKLKFFCRKWY